MYINAQETGEGFIRIEIREDDLEQLKKALLTASVCLDNHRSISLSEERSVIDTLKDALDSVK